MLRRCYTRRNSGYKDYGAKGVQVCDRWRGKDGFWNFVEDIGDKPAGYTLDRINSNDGYFPGNCRWASVTTQSINKGIQKSNKSGVIGVNFSKRYGKWEAWISIKRTQIFLGRFFDKEDAIKIRKKAESKYHKPYLEV